VAPGRTPRYGAAVRSLALWDAGEETALEGLQADHLMAAVVALEPERALMRVWARREPGLSVGRFHRIDPAAHGLARRLTGGRVVPVGPGVLGITLAAPAPAWLVDGARELRPEQVLNRALRPLLGVLRALGLDAFYPGRDVVTLASRPLAYASFCTFPDDVVCVEQFLAVDAAFANLDDLLREVDTRGVAAADRSAFANAVSLAELVPGVARRSLVESLAAQASERFACSIERSRPVELAAAVAATAAAFEALQAERAELPAGRASVAEIAMLGAIEACARIDDGRLWDVEITGDVIAPFHTVEELERACEGEVAGGAGVRASVTRVLSGPRNFVLGWPDPAALLTRLG